MQKEQGERQRDQEHTASKDLHGVTEARSSRQSLVLNERKGLLSGRTCATLLSQLERYVPFISISHGIWEAD